ERTHSAIYLGYAGLVQFFPQVLLMLFAGHIVDTYNRKRVFMAALACNAAAAAGLAVNASRGGSIYVLYGCLLAYGTAREFILPDSGMCGKQRSCFPRWHWICLASFLVARLQ